MASIGVGTHIGPYEILRRIGAGGMGAVFEALHGAIERRVAIKILLPQNAENPEITTRFLNEARAVNRVAHPGIVQISDLGQLPDGTAYLVMELLVGETLGGRLRRLGGRLPLPQALDLGSQVADALAAAHNKGIIHRDLKPENLMVVADPVAPRGERIKVLDFGIAKLTETPGVSAADTTRSNLLMGTPRYMSPEQCRGAGKIDAKADVYSLGVLLYQVLAGRLPFVSSAPGELIVMHITEAPPPLLTVAAEVPAAAAALVEQMLAKSAADRPAMADVAQRLQGILRTLEGRPISVLDAPRVSPTAESQSAAAPFPLEPRTGPSAAAGPADLGPATNITPINITSSQVESSGGPGGLGPPAAITTLGRSLGESIAPAAPTLSGRRRYRLAGSLAALLLLGGLGARFALTPRTRAVPAAAVRSLPVPEPSAPPPPEAAGRSTPDPVPSPAPSGTVPPPDKEGPHRSPATKPTPKLASTPPRSGLRTAQTKKTERKRQGEKSLFDKID